MDERGLYGIWVRSEIGLKFVYHREVVMRLQTSLGKRRKGGEVRNAEQKIPLLNV